MHNQRIARTRIGAACVLLLLLAALTLVTPWQAVAQSPSARTMSDDSIRQAIVKRFAASKIGANGFQVEVKNGIAILRGQAGVAQHKGVATRLAKLAGAREVDNQIAISPAAKQRMQDALKQKKPAASKAKPPTVRQESTVAVPPPSSGKPTAATAAPASTPVAAAPEAEPETDADTRAPRLAVKPKPEAKRGEARSERRRY